MNDLVKRLRAVAEKREPEFRIDLLLLEAADALEARPEEGRFTESQVRKIMDETRALGHSMNNNDILSLYGMNKEQE